MTILSVFAGVLLAIWLIGWAITPFGFKKDNTDSFKERSGLTVYVDHMTGVNYVGTFLGGLTVRVDRNGKPVVGDPLQVSGGRRS